MSEQIITILISTLLGGVLTIAGGLAVSYVTHRQTANDERRKEIRDAIEKIYKLNLDIESLYMDAIKHGDNFEEVKNNITFL